MATKDIPVYNIDHLSQFKQKDIQISCFAPYLKVHKNLHLAHKHSFYHLILFTQGAGHHEIDFHRYPVRPYQIYFMIPGQVHSWSFQGPVDGYVINFSVPFFQSFLIQPDYLEQFAFFNGIIEDSVIELPEEIQSEVKAYFDQLVRESEQSQPYGFDMVKSIMLQLFFTIARISFNENTSKITSHNYKLLRKFQKTIEKHYGMKRLPKDYAELLHVTPNHLNAVCKDLLGVSAGEVIRNRIVLEAKRQLINLDLSISEIAYKLNFDDNSYFTKFFRKQAGLTPEEFRREAVRQASNNTQLG
ncbi:MAG: helix-turn-helix transcriptional regulator [Bacteroidota bacterium]